MYGVGGQGGNSTGQDQKQSSLRDHIKNAITKIQLRPVENLAENMRQLQTRWIDEWTHYFFSVA